MSAQAQMSSCVLTYVVVALLLDEFPGLSSKHAHELLVHRHAECAAHHQLVDHRLLELLSGHCARDQAVVVVLVSLPVCGVQGEPAQDCVEELLLGPELWMLYIELDVLESRAGSGQSHAVFVDEPWRKVITLGGQDC